MLTTCKNEDVGLAIVDEKSGGGWQSLMREGSGDGKSWSVGSRSGYSESDEGGNMTTLLRKSLAFGLYMYISCLQVARPKTR